MFFPLLRFEAKYQFKQKAFIGFGIIFLLFGFMLGSQGFAPANVEFNSAYQISYNTALVSLGCIFGIMFFAISGMLRDKQHRTEPIIYSTSVQKGYFFFSRFLGVLLFSLLVFSMFLVGFALGTFMPYLDPERIGVFNLVAYIWVWLIFVLPNVFICTTLIFAVCSFTKSNVATYIGAVFIYALYWACSIFLNSPLIANSVSASPEGLALAAILDPFGISAFFEQTQFWTPFQKNTQLVSFSGNFMWNRLVWGFFSLVLLAVTYKSFSFRTTHQKSKKKVHHEEKIETTKTYLPIETSNINTKKQGLPFLSLLKIELKGVFKSLPFIVVISVWIIIATTEIYSWLNGGGAYNDSLYPTTNLLLGRINEPMFYLGLLLIVFYSGELLWRERNLNLDGIMDATPASNTTFFLSKALTLLLLPLTLMTIGIVIAIGFQLSNGYYQFEFVRYLSEFYYSGFGLLFYILIALFIQNIVRNKYLGMIITGLVIILFGSSLSAKIGIEHPLLRIGHLPEVIYTNMTGYGDYAKPFHYFAVYWGAFGGLLSILSFKLWQRGSTATLGFRIKQLSSNWKKWQIIAFAFFGIVFIASGVGIFYNTNVVTDYITVEEDLDFREAYERRYKKFETLQPLVLMDVSTEMAIYPDENKYQLKANYVLENISDTLISQVLISEQEPLKSINLENAILVEHNSYFETYLYRLKSPLLPHQRLKLLYEIVGEKNGFEKDKGLANNGSYLVNYDFKPVLGYRRNVEITDNFKRENRGLPKRKEEVFNEGDFQNGQSKTYKKIDFETILSTQANQIALAPGDLIKHWTENGRNYYHFKTTHKIIPVIGYFSANYTVKKETYKGISVEQYYHPAHYYNIENIQKSSKIALDYCTKNFGEYPFNHLRIAEIPSFWGFGGYAHAGTISMVGDRLYLVDNRNPESFDLVAKRTIHEVSHQYWGHTLPAKNIDGGSLLVEGLAKYTEAVVMEKMYGKRAIWQLSKTANNAYFSGRSFATEPEPPLYLVNGQSYLSYGKSYTVMWALKVLLGEDKVNAVLRDLLEKHKDDIKPQATSLELIAGLYATAPKKYHQLIDDWFKKVITYDLKIESTSFERRKNGTYEVTIDISAKRFEIRANGEMVQIPINEPVPIGIFAKHPSQTKLEDTILYLRPIKINKEHQQLKIIVDELPQYIAVDPYGTRLDENRVDNIVEL